MNANHTAPERMQWEDLSITSVMCLSKIKSWGNIQQTEIQEQSVEQLAWNLKKKMLSLWNSRKDWRTPPDWRRLETWQLKVTHNPGLDHFVIKDIFRTVDKIWMGSVE